MTEKTKIDNVREVLMGTPKVNENQEPSRESPRFSFGCLLADLVVGGDKNVLGIPAGVIINLVGDKSAGKTFLKNELIAASYHQRHGKGIKWFSDDTETGDTFNTSKLYGFDIHPDGRKIGTHPVEDTHTVEELDGKISLFTNSLKPDEIGVYAVDSLDGLTDSVIEKMAASREKQVADGADEIKDKGDYGMKISKFLSGQLFKHQHSALASKNCLLIIVSQIRENIGAGLFAKKWKVSCGKALEFFCHTRIFLQSVKAITTNGVQIGTVVKMSTFKSKTPRPYRSCYFTFYFTYGIDDIGSSLDYLYDLRSAEEFELVASRCKSIPWDSTTPCTLTSLRDWLKAENWDKECSADKKSEGKGPQLSVDYIVEWAQKDEIKKTSFSKTFGTACTRDELISRIEKDPKMKKELDHRVMAKWEEFEESIRVDRKGKYE